MGIHSSLVTDYPVNPKMSASSILQGAVPMVLLIQLITHVKNRQVTHVKNRQVTHVKNRQVTHVKNRQVRVNSSIGTGTRLSRKPSLVLK